MTPPPQEMSLAELRSRVRVMLTRGGLPDPAVEADALIAAIRGSGRGQVHMDSLLGRTISAREADTLLTAARRRARREPLQHITGTAPFLDAELRAGPGAFVPRPETEGLVLAAETVIRDIAGRDPALAAAGMIDLGSGTGAIAIGLARRLQDLLPGLAARITALEGSPAAWPYLLRNAPLGLGLVEPRFGRIGDIRPLRGALPAALIVSNPPYIPAAQLPADPEVWLHDPPPALYSGSDGLDAVREIVRFASEWLLPNGGLLLEHDERQGPAIRALMGDAGFRGACTDRDLAGRDRITSARRPAAPG